MRVLRAIRVGATELIVVVGPDGYAVLEDGYLVALCDSYREAMQYLRAEAMMEATGRGTPAPNPAR